MSHDEISHLCAGLPRKFVARGGVEDTLRMITNPALPRQQPEERKEGIDCITGITKPLAHAGAFQSKNTSSGCNVQPIT
jgi:hypothetical protein